MNAQRAIPAALLAMLLVAAGCAPSASPSSDPAAPIRVVTTSTVFGDLVHQTGGDQVAVTSLVPPGVDVHTYQATPADLQDLAEADLVIMNGLGLDDWLADMIESVSGGPQSRVPIVRLAEDGVDYELLPGEEPDTRNPHLWMDVSYAIQYVERIETALVAAAPAKAADIGRSSEAYRAAISELDGWVREQISTIPVENRKLVTFHDALPYFARAYGLEIVGVAVEAPGQDPSAGEIAALIDAIRATGVKAIFSEDQFPTTLVDQIGRETGATVEADLFTDSLGDDPITSYEALIRWNVEQIVTALR